MKTEKRLIKCFLLSMAHMTSPFPTMHLFPLVLSLTPFVPVSCLSILIKVDLHKIVSDIQNQQDLPIEQKKKLRSL